MITAAVEDYAKAIYALSSAASGRSPTTPLPSAWASRAASASAMVKKLDGLGLVSHVPYQRRRADRAPGARVALEVLRHHRLLELYLAQSLGVPWDRVHDEAEVLEHHISEELEELIATSSATRRTTRTAIRSPRATLDDRGAPTGRSTRSSPATRARSCASRTPTPRCCATWPSAGSRRATSSRSIDKQPFGGPLFVRFGDEVHVSAAAGRRDARGGGR